jgi:hypothetical protein
MSKVPTDEVTRPDPHGEISQQIQAMALTHDTSRVNYHVEDIRDFVKKVEQATLAAFPNKHSTRYSGVFALLLSWEEDDLSVITEVEALQKVFDERYGFTAEEWKIPSEDSHEELGDRLRAFTKSYAKDDTLLIIYYGGHGFLNRARQSVWLW